jgi:hypothetical protein
MLAARAVGPDGHAIGIDMTEPMAAFSPKRARALSKAAAEMSSTQTQPTPLLRTKSTRRESPPPMSMIQVAGPRPTDSRRRADTVGTD